MGTSTWTKSTIGAQATLQRGIDITKAAQRPGTVPVISSGGIASYHDTAAVSGPGVILGRKGVVGSVYYIDEDYWPHDTALWVKDFHGNHPRFVYYFFKWLTPTITQMDVGSANPTLNRNHVHPIEVNWPPIPEQKRIAHILGTLDDKIELNRRMNATLEAMARALFQSWFVDFDPVRAKAAGKTPAGMDKATVALFPSKFEDSASGKIPNGWKMSTVADEFELTMGQSPPGSTYNEVGEGMPFYQGRTDFGFRFPTRRVYCTAPTRLANPGDTLVSVRAPVGDLNIAEDRCAIGRGVAAVRHRSGSRSLTYYAMQTFRERFNHFEGEGTVFGSINRKDFEKLSLVAPPVEIAERFDRIASRIDDAVENNEKQSRTLGTLRDTLLPKLLSGGLSIADAERGMKS
jgi:type I restriction enzyme S subunit